MQIRSVAAGLVFVLQTGVPGQSVQWASPLTGWGEAPMAMTEQSPGEYRLEIESPWLPVLPYKFVVEGSWIADPRVGDRVPDGWGGFNSIVRTGFTEDPMLSARPGVPLARVQTLHVRDWQGVDRAIPVISAPAGRPSVTVYLQDGNDYLQQGGIVELISNLSAGRRGLAITAVLIPARDRMNQYAPGSAEGDHYAEFVARTLVPAVEERWLTTGGAPERRLLIGPSMGGLITLATALRYPDVFGLAASQSGSIWYREPVIQQLLRDAPAKPRLWLDAGIYEPLDHMAVPNRRFTELARSLGFDVEYREYPSTHDWIAWRNRLQTILRYFF